MKKSHGGSLDERRQAAIEAKQKMLVRFKAAPKPDDPQMIEKRKEREAIAAAREARRLAREEDKKREEAEAAQRAIEEAAALEEQRRIEADKAVAEAAERKAERDRRYAARRARKR